LYLEETLIVLFSYAEAHKIKLKADALEAWELEKWHSERQQDLLQKEAKFKYNKQQELLALQKRIQTGREEQKKQRHLDLERYYLESTDLFAVFILWCRLLQRYQNVKAELEAQQNLERIRMEKMVQSGSLTSISGNRTRPKSETGKVKG
jgi:hypothetical protein